MSKQKTQKNKDNKTYKEKFREMLGTKKMTNILLVIIAIPLLIFGLNLLTAELGKSKPVIGSRFEHGLDPEITAEDLSNIEELVHDDRYTETDVILKVSTLRLYIEVDDTVSKEEMIEIANKTYDIVTAELPVEEYFTVINNQQKQYDLEIHVYSDLAEEKEGQFKYYQINKSSSMDEPKGQMLSDPKDPDFAADVKKYAEELEQAQEEESNDE